MHGTMGAVEVIASVQRRRRWSAAEKQEIVAESAKPGRTVSEVARRFGIAPSQLFTWRRQLLAAATGVSGDGFLSVAVSSPMARPAIAPSATATGEDGHIEIVLPTGVVVRVGRGFAADTLRQVLATLG